MGEMSKIQWTHHTLNPWIGCTKVAAECEKCYAADSYFTSVKRAQGVELWGPRGQRHMTKTLKEALKWNRKARDAGERHRVFCASLADVLEDRRDLDARRAELWDIIDECQDLDWLLLSKRPENFATRTPDRWRALGQTPLNVWAGTSAGTQKTADDFIPKLLEAAPWAVVRFVSCEPMLEPVDLRSYMPQECRACDLGYDEPENGIGECTCTRPVVGWVICGAESGSNARPFDLQWGRDILRQCMDAGVPAFMKQIGARPSDSAAAWSGSTAAIETVRHPKGGDPSEWPEDLRVREFPR